MFQLSSSYFRKEFCPISIQIISLFFEMSLVTGHSPVAIYCFLFCFFLIRHNIVFPEAVKFLHHILNLKCQLHKSLQVRINVLGIFYCLIAESPTAMMLIIHCPELPKVTHSAPTKNIWCTGTDMPFQLLAFHWPPTNLIFEFVYLLYCYFLSSIFMLESSSLVPSKFEYFILVLYRLIFTISYFYWLWFFIGLSNFCILLTNMVLYFICCIY
jgi:hypothetical protein